MIKKRKNKLNRILLHCIIVITVVVPCIISLSQENQSAIAGVIPSEQNLIGLKQKPLLLVSTLPATITPQAAPAGVLDSNESKMYIYNKESGNRSTARNSGGCLGIGQACPGSKLLAVCPDLNDYACQDNFFTNYMLARYKSWENAKAFHIKNNWW